MAITFPLAMPTSPTFSEMKWRPITVVGATKSPYTGQRQTFVWPGQWWEVACVIPVIKKDSEADAWVAWKLALNGQQGTFLLGPSTRKASLGSVTGVLQVGAGAAANSTTLPLQGGGGGSLAVGDWLQIGNYLHKVLQVNSPTSVDVFPRLRAAYAQTTVVTYVNAKGLFALASNDMEWTVDVAKMTGLVLSAVEAL